jgi:proteasome lid subunit RPN8/RPN11
MSRSWEPRLPSCLLRGRVLITHAALRGCEDLLPTYRGIDGDHEGIAFLCGRELGDVQLLTTAIAPRCDHGRRRVMCDESQIEDVVAVAHAHRLGVLAQVHSHPGPFTEHSEGDDEMVLMPFEGMLSIVVPHYARHRLQPVESLGVHQYQDGRWVTAEPASVAAAVTIIPGNVDLR